MGPGDRMRGAIELARPGNCLTASVLTFIGALVGGGVPGKLVATSGAVIATGLAVAAGNGINDYFDREIDATNQPDRPIPRGAVSPQFALGQSLVLFAVAVALALTLPRLAIGIALVNLVLLVTYTTWFKGTAGAGNAVVAFLGGSTFFFGGAAVGGPRRTVVLFALGAFATFGREIIKDIEDMRGDAAAELRTLPLLIGPTRARWIAGASLGIAALASPVPFLLELFGVTYLAVVGPGIATMFYGAIRAGEDPARGQRLVKIGMYIAVLAFIVGHLTPTV